MWFALFCGEWWQLRCFWRLPSCHCLILSLLKTTEIYCRYEHTYVRASTLVMYERCTRCKINMKKKKNARNYDRKFIIVNKDNYWCGPRMEILARAMDVSRQPFYESEKKNATPNVQWWWFYNERMCIGIGENRKEINIIIYQRSEWLYRCVGVWKRVCAHILVVVAHILTVLTEAYRQEVANRRYSIHAVCDENTEHEIKIMINAAGAAAVAPTTTATPGVDTWDT